MTYTSMHLSRATVTAEITNSPLSIKISGRTDGTMVEGKLFGAELNEITLFVTETQVEEIIGKLYAGMLIRRLMQKEEPEERLLGFDRCVSTDCLYLATHIEQEGSGEKVKCYVCRIGNDEDECAEGEEE